MASIECYEGGARGKKGGKEDFSKSQLAAGDKVKKLFKNEDVLGKEHLQKVGAEMQAHGSKEKTGFMEKEADFVKELKHVQGYHLETCILLMYIAIGAFVLECCYSLFCIFYFGCGFGDCENNLICCVHYIKFAQTIFLINTYLGNIKEKQPNHPIGTLNSFLVIVLYIGCLYQYIDILNPKESNSLVHFCIAYPILDALLILISFIMIGQVKNKSKELIENKRFKEYNQEAIIALADILYLPQEYESDDGEEDF